MNRLARLALPAILTWVTATGALASPETETEHVVEDGETLNGIANRAKVSASAIVKANGLKEPYVVRVGQKLKIPRDAKPKAASAPAKSRTASGGSSYVVESGDSLLGIAVRNGISMSDLAKANGIAEPYAIRIGQKLTIPGGGSSSSGGSSKRPAPSYPSHTVKEGETLGGISNRTGVPKAVIADANDLDRKLTVKAGQKLTIPKQRTHLVEPGDTGFGLAYKYGVPYSAIVVANGMKPDDPLIAGRKLLIPAITGQDGPVTRPSGPAPVVAASSSRFSWPLRGPVRQRFSANNEGTGHNGVDLDASAGAPVRAAAAGIVIYAQMEKKRFGNLVIIDHGDRWHTAYGYLSRISVKKGAGVKAGETIGTAGSTGMAESPQLHFEVRRFNKPVDPVALLGSPE